ncbi:hypothetical protein BX661DRAFT_214451 [Kickxella alabastrina]|uniref:uncharacterized protein n=1 Tax=Kickxella alabastrina TaxID=61397 RepID=UPI00221EEA9C|nr:uncharacterized protein BX661DRAFT_214451 [Kickxella alabastrina]KAI7825465.1 hypothetical protein BX661DRAFT_214451 [Kickxella alabastrina]
MCFRVPWPLPYRTSTIRPSATGSGCLFSKAHHHCSCVFWLLYFPRSSGKVLVSVTRSEDFIVSYKRKEKTLGGSENLAINDTKRALADWQLWCMVFGTFAACAACNSLSVFAPEVINKMGFSPTQAQVMSALPSACGTVALLFAGQIVKVCRSHWVAGCLVMSVALTGSVIMIAALSVPVRVFGLCLVGAGSFAGQGILPGWVVTANSQTVANSAVASTLTYLWALRQDLWHRMCF